jgi:hypothetical protein
MAGQTPTPKKRGRGRPKGSSPKTLTRRALVKATWLGEQLPDGERPTVSPRVRDYLVELAAMRDKDIADAFNRAIDGAKSDMETGTDFAKAQARRFIARLCLNVTQVSQNRDRINIQAASAAIEAAKVDRQYTLAEVESSFRRALSDPKLLEAAGADDAES